MLTTMETHCPWKVRTNYMPSFLHIGSSVKEKRIEEIHDELEIFFPTIYHVIHSITDRYHCWWLVTTHNQHVNQQHFFIVALSPSHKRPNNAALVMMNALFEL